MIAASESLAAGFAFVNKRCSDAAEAAMHKRAWWKAFLTM
jgi:hypothetical protein